jgi:hypothetical protein
MSQIDPAIKAFAVTERQVEYIDAVIAQGSIGAAERELGVSAGVIARVVRTLKARLLESQRQEAIQPRGTAGFVARELTTAYDEQGNESGSWLREGPAATCAPGGVDEGPERDGGDGYIIKGVSTYFGADGSQRGQWVKTKLDDVRRAELMKAAAVAMAEDLPRVAPIARPLSTQVELCNLYTLTDCHMGMLAWHKEGGDDWDISIAERTLVGCFEQMIAAAPAAQTAIVNQLGDFLHYDSLTAVTPSHGHILDADGRFSKMVAATIRTLRKIVDIALMRHARVIVILAEGNHDMASSVWLRHMFKALYEDEPRVVIDDSELPYYVHQHGAVMLGFHHGHLSKKHQLPLLFAAQHAVIWGATTKRYIHTGHEHHVDEKEHAGVTVIQHPTLAARDAYAARGGWISERQATAMTYHTKFGLVARNTVTPEMLG